MAERPGGAGYDVDDDLGVLDSTRFVVERARLVRIDREAVERLADGLAARESEPPAWRTWPHWWDDGDPERTAAYVLVLDALNFSFWGEPKWRVGYGGQLLDGYWALVASLRRAIEADVPILDPRYLRDVDESVARRLFVGEGRIEIPMLAERVANLREVGRGLERLGGSALALVKRAAGSAVALVRALVERFPSFDDVAAYEGRPVRLYKRAQILVGDLYGAFGGVGPGRFIDLDRLTAFADYKVPQVLRELGVLVYHPDLAERVDRCVEIGAGAPEEVEIRAATIWACEHLKDAINARLARSGRPSIRAFEVDWALWSDAQGRELAHPYHRTRTLFY